MIVARHCALFGVRVPFLNVHRVRREVSLGCSSKMCSLEKGKIEVDINRQNIHSDMLIKVVIAI